MTNTTITLTYDKPIPGTLIDGSTGTVNRGETILGDFIDLSHGRPKDLESFAATPDYDSDELVMGTKKEIINWFETRKES